MLCPLCKRDIPNDLMERHHLRTRRTAKDTTEHICQDCHRMLHGLFGNTDIRNSSLGLDTVDGILADEDFNKALKHIRKIPPGALKIRESNRRGRR